MLALRHSALLGVVAIVTCEMNALGQQWIRQFGTSETDFPFALSTDGVDGMFVAGATTGSLGGQNAGEADAWIARYSGEGNRLWIQQFGTIASDSWQQPWEFPEMAFDLVRGVSVMYSPGRPGFGSVTYEWDGDKWFQRAAGFPTGRTWFGLVYDAGAGVVLTDAMFQTAVQ